MAQVTGLFASYKLAMLGSGPHGAVDLDADTINLVLVSIDDTPVLASDQDLADITSGERVSTVTLGTKTTTGGKWTTRSCTTTRRRRMPRGRSSGRGASPQSRPTAATSSAP
jgi:hypothetical protein